MALNGLQADGVVLRPVRVAAAFADAVRSLPDVVLDCDAPAEAVVLADRVLLADLVRNLALNAWHAGRRTARSTCAAPTRANAGG